MNANQRHPIPGAAKRGGFTIVELLMSLMLVSVLLTAIAMAMKASMDSYEQNRNISAVSQASRSLAMRMQRELRQAEAVDYTAGASKVVITPPASASGLQEITYTYNSANKTLTQSLRYTDSGKDTTETLFDSSSEVELSGFFVTYKTVLNAQGLSCTQRVICTTYFTIDGQTSPLVFTASPRRNQTY
jgi:prepilin-type N-terminal cleavage/methylation domain-containing protein